MESDPEWMALLTHFIMFACGAACGAAYFYDCVRCLKRDRDTLNKQLRGARSAEFGAQDEISALAATMKQCLDLMASRLGRTVIAGEVPLTVNQLPSQTLIQEVVRRLQNTRLTSGKAMTNGEQQ